MVRVATIISVFAALSFVASVATAAPLKFFRFKIDSEASENWEHVLDTDPAHSHEALGLFADKKKSDTKLIAFRMSDFGDKSCMKEFSKMRLQKQTFEKMKAPKGWACVYFVKDAKRYTAIRSFFIRTKSKSTAFSLVLVGESMPEERFLKAVSTLKDLK